MSKESKTKKPFYKRWWFIAIVVILILGGIGGGMNGGKTEEGDKKENPTTVTETTAAQTSVTNTEITTESTAATTTEETTTIATTTEEVTNVSETISEEVVREAIIVLLNNNFKNLGEFEYNSELDGFYVTSSDDEFNAALMLIANGNTEMIQTWNDTVVTSWINMSNSLKENFPDYNYSIGMINPFNKENFLLIVKDGVVVYDFSKNVE